MNFLAHSMISFALDDIESKYQKTQDMSGKCNTLFGNFAGDFYKGRVELLMVEKHIKQGVMLHRLIDRTTDRHENFLNPLLAPKFGIFKGIIADIFIDHFIAQHFVDLFQQEIDKVEQQILHHIHQYQAEFPSGFARLFNWLSHNNALSNYAEVDFLEQQVFAGMSQRVKRGEILHHAVNALKQNYAQFETLSIQEFRYTEQESLKKFLEMRK